MGLLLSKVNRWRSRRKHEGARTCTTDAASSLPEEKFYDPKDTTLIFVDGDDDMDFECMNYKSLRARMSCGHTATPMSLTTWCREQLDQGGSEFRCGQADCDVEWSFKEVCKMALLTPGEIEEFEKKMFSNFKESNNVKSCPGCNSSVLRTDFNNLSVRCTVCTAEKNRTYDFCWQCLREWRGPLPRSDHCGNEGCFNNDLDILKTCSVIKFKDVKGVINCPSVRACPTCGILVEHDRTGCKNITCSRCKEEFCFVCLKISEECLDAREESWYEHCLSRAAPRQTSIPQWQCDPSEVESQSEDENEGEYDSES